MLVTGDKAPAFDLVNDQGELQSLQDLLQEGPLILYFYPADFTPVCTKEACGIRDIYSDIGSVGMRVVGVSPQSEESHRRFKDRFDLPFPLVHDAGKKLIDAYGVNGPFGIGVRRVTFLINKDGYIEQRLVSDLFAGNHIEFIKKIVSR